ncbi:MAG: tetratricopeptide repeat protein, partial [Planctomycetota bacterium]
MKPGTSTKRMHGHRKQVLLFLVAVILPSSVLIVLTWHMISQQQELSEKRLADERRRLATEISRELLAHLEEIKLHEVRATSGKRLLNATTYMSSEVVLTALVDGDRMLLPWETNLADNRSSIDQTAFFQEVRNAEQEEYVRKRYALANTLYLKCIEQAKQPSQQAYARLSRARVLGKLGDVEESLAEYRKILEVSSETKDEHGIPFRLYAAARLLEKGDSHDEVLQLIAGQLNAQRWLLPAESYIIRDLAQTCIKSGPESRTWRQTAADCETRILQRISRQEEVLNLQKDFPKLKFIAQWENTDPATESIWIPYGDEPWLVTLAPASPTGRRLAVIVRGESVLDSILSNVVTSEPILENVRLTANTDLEGEALGPSLPGLHLAYATDGGDFLSAKWGPQRSVYLVTLLLVLCVTLFGAYVLWRDVGRELQMAEMRSQFIASVSHELKTPLTA